MRVLWSSNAPHAGSGYGVQTDLFARRLGRDGHSVSIRANWGLAGAVIQYAQGVKVFPQSHAEGAVDVLRADVKAIRPDVTVILYDIWIYPVDVLKNTRAAVWIPIENDPIPKATLEKAKNARHLMAMSQFGERELRRNGVDCWYVPHGVDTQLYKPLAEREALRESYGIQPGQFVAVTVAANKGKPSRKNLPEMFAAWAKFVKECPDAVFIVHSNPDESHGGLDLVALAEFYGIPDDNIRFTDVYKLINAQYTPAVMNEIYNIADVFLLPSAGEGFGVPAIEAQSAGCPVILSDFTAQSELVAPGGWKIAIDEDDKVYSPMESHWARPKPSRIASALLEAKCKPDEERRIEARKFALQYDADRVYLRYMLPALETIAAINAGERGA